MDDRQHSGERDPKIAGRSGTVSRHGMIVAWRSDANTVEFSMRWPSQGWAAIGLNTRSGLTGTQLMMVSVVNGRAIVSDRHIVAAGDHRTVRSLGGSDHVRVREGRCDATGCEAVLVVERVARDQLHHTIQAGREYSLLIAYSAVADLTHHSLFRTEVAVRFESQSGAGGR